jgi:hypothetical protein
VTATSTVGPNQQDIIGSIGEQQEPIHKIVGTARLRFFTPLTASLIETQNVHVEWGNLTSEIGK